MAFVENLDQFFEQDDFAVEAVFTRGATPVATCDVIFDVPTEYAGFDNVQVATDNPYCTAKTSAVSAVRRKDTCTIGGTGYKVAQIKHDGTGVTRIDLELY